MKKEYTIDKNKYVHKDLEISDERDDELSEYTIGLGRKVMTVADFLRILEHNEFTLIEKLYMSAQFGRLTCDGKLYELQ